MKKTRRLIIISLLSYPIAGLICMLLGLAANAIDGLLEYWFYTQFGIPPLISLAFNRNVAICCLVFSINICVLVKALSYRHETDSTGGGQTVAEDKT